MVANDPGQPRLATDAWTSNLPPPRSALAVGAHPDDVEFGAGGTLAKWAETGCTVHHLVCTDGSKGTWNPDADLPALISVRREEQRRAAARLAGPNAGEVRFLGYIDGELDNGRAGCAAVARVIRELRPEVVLGHDPWKRYRLHPDHRHAGWLVCDGVVAARDPHFFGRQGLAPFRPSALLLWEADEPNHVEDVSEFVETKLDALVAHESQFESTMHAADDRQLGAFRARVTDRLAELGAGHGLAAAELFRLVADL